MRAEIKRRVRSRALLRGYRGVYRVGHRAPGVEAGYMAAVLAGGEGALLSGRAAAYLLGIVKGGGAAARSCGADGAACPGRRDASHASRRGRHDLACPGHHVARTLVDLAATLNASDLARACHEAGIRHHTTPAHVDAVLARRPRTPSAAKLRDVLHGDVAVTLSRLESRFLQRLRQAGLPRPQTNRPATGRRVDCRWPAHRLTVELDGYRYHRSRHAWEQDRAREREARARGDEFRRYTYGDVVEPPAFMLTELRRLLDPLP